MSLLEKLDILGVLHILQITLILKYQRKIVQPKKQLDCQIDVAGRPEILKTTNCVLAHITGHQTSVGVTIMGVIIMI